jgi:hypothetical protein
MTRRRDWSPLCDGDPVPGDPDAVDLAGRHYRSMADEIDHQVARLRAIAGGEGLEGGYVKTFTESSTKLAGDLAKTSGRYREVGGALVGWAPTLRGFQDDAERLWQRAEDAQLRAAANAEVPTATRQGSPPPEPTSEDRARAARHDTAVGDVASVHRDLEDLRSRRDRAADRVADSIRDGSDDDVTDSWWDNFKDWMDANAGWIKTVTDILGVIGVGLMILSLFVPGLNIISALALGATALTLAGHSALAAAGNGSWVDVGLDVLALATFGAGKVIGPGSKLGAKVFGKVLGSGGRAVWAGHANLAQREVRELGAVRHAREVVRAVRQTQPWRDVSAVRSAARQAYRQAPVELLGTRFEQALKVARLGGTDPELAAIVDDVARTAQQFPNAVKVTEAVANAHRLAATSRNLFATSAALGTVGTILDQVPPFKAPWGDVKDQFVHEVGSTW